MRTVVVLVVLLVLGLHCWHLFLNPTTTPYTSIVTSHLLVFLLLWSYIQCCTTDSFISTHLKHGNSMATPMAAGGAVCPKCRISKTPRSHHCRKCNQCVLKMDHHCPWVGHCVGEKNYKYYVLFLVYTTLALFDVVVGSFQRMLHPDGWSTAILAFTAIVTVGQIVMGCCVAYLLLWHVMQCSRNCTTIEWYQNQKNSRQHASKVAKFPWPNTFPKESPYDRGVYLNCTWVFGRYMLWLIPVVDRSMRGGNEGSEHKTNARSSKNIV